MPRDNAPNLAPGNLIFVDTLAVAAAATVGRYTRQLGRREFAEAFILLIAAPPTLVTTPATTPSVMQVLLQSQNDAGTTFLQLPSSPLLVNPGCPLRWPLPGWIERLNIDLRAVSGADLVTQVDVVAKIALYRFDRTTREEDHS